MNDWPLPSLSGQRFIRFDVRPPLTWHRLTGGSVRIFQRILMRWAPDSIDPIVCISFQVSTPVLVRLRSAAIPRFHRAGFPPVGCPFHSRLIFNSSRGFVSGSFSPTWPVSAATRIHLGRGAGHPGAEAGADRPVRSRCKRPDWCIPLALTAVLLHPCFTPVRTACRTG